MSDVAPRRGSSDTTFTPPAASRRSIVEPCSPARSSATSPDDLRFALDLGLVRMTTEEGLDMANPLYREIVVWALSLTPQASLPRIPTTWLTPAGGLEEDRLPLVLAAAWRAAPPLGPLS